MRIVALSGSLRSGSCNTALARALRDHAPDGCEVEVATPAGIPLYDGDVEAASGIPEAAEALKSRIAEAHGLIVVTPEYNQSIPGVFKNALDWLTRPPGDIKRVFGGKPVGLCGATLGGAGTRSAQYAWLPILRTLGTRLYSEQRLFLSKAGDVFDASGAIVDDDTSERVIRLIGGFARFAAQQHT